VRNLDKSGILKPVTPPAGSVPLRGPSGRLYGYFNPKTLQIEVKRKNDPSEVIDLKPFMTELPV
jgi:hypothetical protein